MEAPTRLSRLPGRVGVDHIVSLGHNQGLAKAFMAGLDAALAIGADVVVNTDADNQYVGADVARLTKPIVNREADMVVGARPIGDTPTSPGSRRHCSVWVARSSGASATRTSKTRPADSEPSRAKPLFV